MTTETLGAMAAATAPRPFERRVLRLRADGVPPEEIARRFNRSPAHIDRVIALAALPGRSTTTSVRGGLRALERRVLRWRSYGLDHGEIARRFRRSPDHIRRIEGLALYKQSLRLLKPEALS
jgi:DNA-binding CsgD family transcriptional regulator